MTKSELIEALAESQGIPRRTAEEVVQAFFDAMKDALATGGRVEIRGFGSFKVKDYEGYWGRNPKTNQPHWVKPKRLPVFKPSDKLNQLVNKDLE